MGNTNTKRSDDYSSYSHRKKSKEFVDQQINYGSLVTHGIYTAQPEYDIEVVRGFILKKKISPFYKGMEEYLDNPFPTQSTPSPSITPSLSVPQEEASLENRRRSRNESFSSVRSRKSSTHKSDLEDNLASSSSSPSSAVPVSTQNTIKVESEHHLYSKEEFFKYPIECPICFLYYPRNINYTRCCDQPICTECFIQIKRTFQNPEPTCCPYCVQPNFGVTYLSPDSEEYREQYDILVKAKEQHDPEAEKLLSQESTPGKKRRNSISHTDPHIVTSDDIYPGWMLKYEQYQREQRRLEAMRVRNFNVQVNNNAALALLDAFLQLPTENSNSQSNQNSQSSQGRQRRGHTLQALGNDLEELMLLEAIRRSLADSNSQTEENNNLVVVGDENSNEITNENDNTSNISLTNGPEESTENILDPSNEDHTTVDNTIDNSVATNPNTTNSSSSNIEFTTTTTTTTTNTRQENEGVTPQPNEKIDINNSNNIKDSAIVQ